MTDPLNIYAGALYWDPTGDPNDRILIIAVEFARSQEEFVGTILSQVQEKFPDYHPPHYEVIQIPDTTLIEYLRNKYGKVAPQINGQPVQKPVKSPSEPFPS